MRLLKSSLRLSSNSVCLPVACSLLFCLGCGSSNTDSPKTSSDGSAAVAAAAGEALKTSKTQEADPYAPPTDQQVIADVTKNGKDVIEVIPSSKSGKKSWSSVYDQYFWERGLVIRAKSRQFGDLKDVVCEIGGFARYEITGGRYVFREFKTLWVEYEGVPRPSDEEVLALIERNKASLFRGTSARMVNEAAIEVKIAPPDSQEYTWHNPKSLSLKVAVKWEAIESNTEVSKFEGIWEVRLYRDALDQPWTRLICSDKTSNKLETKSYTTQEVREMTTLSSVFKDENPN